MPRSMFAGSTDYSSQSLDDILSDLNDWHITLNAILQKLKESIEFLQVNNHWLDIPVDFRELIATAIKFYETGVKEIQEIKEQIPAEVEPHHISRLSRLGASAYQLNLEFGRVWHKYVQPALNINDYNTTIWHIEQLYGKGRDMSVDLMDLSNAADRLKDYVGRKGNLDQSMANVKTINVNIGRDFSGNLIVGDDNEAKNET